MKENRPMKKKSLAIVVSVTLVVLMFSGPALAADYYWGQDGSYPQFMMYKCAEGEICLYIWGSAVTTATGHDSISASSVDQSHDLIKSWYATMLVEKIVGSVVRIQYDPATGTFNNVIPQ